jgi:hypothetical protein
MNCSEFRQRLMESTDLSVDDAASRAHLLECADCRAVRRRLAQIESHVPLIPVPASRGAARVKEEILGLTHPRSQATRAVARSGWTRRLVRVGLAVTALAVLLAAGVYVGDWASRLAGPVVHKPRPKPEPAAPKKSDVPVPNSTDLARRILDCNLELAQTRNPQERVEILGRLADILNSETPGLVQERKAKELHVVADLYGRVVREGIVRRAQAFPGANGRDTLQSTALKLELSSRANSELARISSPEMVADIQHMAHASREAAMTLRELAKEGAQ